MATNRRSARADEDLTAKARIRDAAIRLIAERGLAEASVKEIAAAAGVSPPLVMHHFGSKDGLRVECDRYVNEVVWRMKSTLGATAATDPLGALRASQTDGMPVLEYLARTLPEGSVHSDAMVDAMVAESEAYLERAAAEGSVKPSTDGRARAVVLVLWQLGALVLHRHAERLLGADLTGPSEATLAWWRPAGEILANGVLAPGAFPALESPDGRAGSPADEGNGGDS